MKKLDRYNLIQLISRELQKQMTTTDINIFLGGFSIEHSGAPVVPSKRLYVQDLINNEDDDVIMRIADELGLELPIRTAESSSQLENLLSSNGLTRCHESFTRALRSIPSDADSAVANASSTLESICKAILDAVSEPYPADPSLAPLLKLVLKRLNLSADGHADPEIKRVLHGLLSTGVGLGVLRTKHSAAHGKGKRQKALAPRHARLAVNSLSTIGLFLIETYIERFSNDRGSLGDFNV